MAAKGADSFTFSPVGRRHSKEGGHRVSVAFTPNDQIPQVAVPSSSAAAAPLADHAPVSPLSGSGGSSGSSHAIGATGPASGSIASSGPRNIAWCCGSCGYHMLAMDHNGQPLALSTDAFGKPIPLQCPRCALEHTNWEQSVPFDKNGDYVNIRSAFSNHLVSTTGKTHDLNQNERSGSSSNLLTLLERPTQPAPASGKQRPAAAVALVIPPILQAIGTVTYRDDQVVNLAPKKAVQTAAPLAYFCGKCSRRMQRVDQFGKLVPLELDPYGEVVPMTCPGCKQTHADWVTKPFQAGGS